MRFALIALALFARLVAPAMAVGFQHVTAADPDDQPLEVGIWYPSDAPTSPRPLGFFSQTVAVDGPVAGNRLPLILFSHGNGGSFAEHYDTALTLAKAGFVVASVTHTGDNFRDQSKMSQVVNRPRHVSRVLDYMLAVWLRRDRLDPDRVGIFGFSSGGFTALVSVGAVPDMARLGPHCTAHRQDFACRVIGERRVDPPANSPPSAWIHDVRIKAAVVAAPALSLTLHARWTFGGQGADAAVAPGRG
jgi:predicted dienelactone hydrolase